MNEDKTIVTILAVGILALMTISIITQTSEANTSAPTSRNVGYKLYGTYWDLMGENGIRNGTMSNITLSANISIPISKPAAPVNGSVFGNTTSKALNWYYNGTWYLANGTEVT